MSSQRNYSVEDFEECEEVVQGVAKMDSGATENLSLELDESKIPKLPPKRFWGLTIRDPKIADIWNGRRSDFPSRSEYDMGMASLLCRRDFTNEEIYVVLLRLRPGKGKEGTKRYFERTISKARNGFNSKVKVDPGRGQLPRINTGIVDLKILSDLGWSAIKKGNDPPVLFRFGGRCCRSKRDDEGRLIIEDLTVDRLRHALVSKAKWYKKSKNGGEIPAKPILDIVRNMLAYPNPPLPLLIRVVEVPVVTGKGEILTEPGYDCKTRIFYDPPNGLVFPPLPEKPSSLDLEKARRLILDELLGEFSFVSDGDLAGAVSLLILPFVRSMIEEPTPLHLIESASVGSGKTLLSEVLLTPGVGNRLRSLAQARDDDEWRKRITACLIAAPEAVLIDNMTIPLDSGELASALTCEEWSDRLLGKSQLVSYPVKCIWVATGNNPTLSTEIVRRSIRIRLDPKCSRPWLRNNFRHENLKEWVRLHRGELVWAALTIVSRWLALGQPLQKAPGLGSYKKWSSVMGGILKVMGVEGFLSNLAELYETCDRESEVWLAIVVEWWNKYKRQEVSSGDLLPIAESSGLEIAGKEQQQRLVSFGTKLAKRRDQMLGDYRITQTRSKGRSLRYRLERTEEG